MPDAGMGGPWVAWLVTYACEMDTVICNSARTGAGATLVRECGNENEISLLPEHA